MYHQSQRFVFVDMQGVCRERCPAPVQPTAQRGWRLVFVYHQRVLGSGSSLFFASPKNDIKAMTPMNDSKRAPLPSAEEEEDPQTNLKDASVTFPDMPTANCKWEEEACQRCIGGTTALTTRVLCSFFFDANSCIQQ